MPSAGGDGVLIWGPSGSQSHHTGSPRIFERRRLEFQTLSNFVETADGITAWLYWEMQSAR